MPSSLQWRQYFEENARSLLEIPWQLGAELTPEEKAAIAQSLKEFQAGESSEDKLLFRYAQEYAARAGDPEYVPANRLLIATVADESSSGSRARPSRRHSPWLTSPPLLAPRPKRLPPASPCVNRLPNPYRLRSDFAPESFPRCPPPRNRVRPCYQSAIPCFSFLAS